MTQTTLPTLWSEVDRAEDCMPLRWQQKYSHALSFQFLDWNDEEVEIEADVKWDGCINWTTNSDCMAHFCEPADAERLTRTFMRAWALTKKHLVVADADSFKDIPDV